MLQIRRFTHRNVSGAPNNLNGPEASTQLRADATVPANTAEATHLRGKDAHQVDESSPIACGLKTKAPITKMGLIYWFLR